MSLPSFPFINHPLTIYDSLNMILASISMEELRLNHINITDTVDKRDCCMCGSTGTASPTGGAGPPGGETGPLGPNNPKGGRGGFPGPMEPAGPKGDRVLPGPMGPGIPKGDRGFPTPILLC